MKFKKIKDGIGDFYGFNAGILREELIALLGEQGSPQMWYANTNQNEIDMNLTEALDTPGNRQAITDLIQAHGTEAMVVYYALLKQWEIEITATDSTLPRYMEDLYDANVDLIKGE